jgi:hypothetical protein
MPDIISRKQSGISSEITDTPLSSPGLTGRSSTPWHLERLDCSGILDSPHARGMTVLFAAN